MHMACSTSAAKRGGCSILSTKNKKPPREAALGNWASVGSTATVGPKSPSGSSGPLHCATTALCSGSHAMKPKIAHGDIGLEGLRRMRLSTTECLNIFWLSLDGLRETSGARKGSKPRQAADLDVVVLCAWAVETHFRQLLCPVQCKPAKGAAHPVLLVHGQSPSFLLRKKPPPASKGQLRTDRMLNCNCSADRHEPEEGFRILPSC